MQVTRQRRVRSTACYAATSCAVYAYIRGARVERVERVAEVVARSIDSMSRDINRSGVGVPDHLLLRILVAQFRGGEFGSGHQRDCGGVVPVGPTSLCL